MDFRKTSGNIFLLASSFFSLPALADNQLIRREIESFNASCNQTIKSQNNQAVLALWAE